MQLQRQAAQRVQRMQERSRQVLAAYQTGGGTVAIVGIGAADDALRRTNGIDPGALVFSAVRAVRHTTKKPLPTDVGSGFCHQPKVTSQPLR